MCRAGSWSAASGSGPGFLVGLGLSALGTAGLAAGGGLWLPFTACLVAGAGQSCRLLARQSYARRVIDVGIRGRLMALYGGIGRVALLIGPLVGGFLADRLGFRPTFAIAALLMMLGLVQGWLAGGSEPILDRAPTRRPPALTTLGRVLRRQGRIIAVAGLGQLGVAVIRFGRLIIIPLYGSEVIGLSVTEIGLVVAIAGSLDLLLFPLAGWVMDEYGRLYAMIPSFLLLAGGMASLPLADSYRSLVVVSLIIGFGNGIGSGTMLTLSTDLAPADNPAEFLSLIRLLADLGRILGPIVVGVIGQWFDLGTAGPVLAAFGLATAVLFAVAIGETSRYQAPHTPGPHS